MSDLVDSATRSRMMAGIRAKDTKPEMSVRKYLYSKKLRYRLHDPRLPGRPDIVLRRFKTVVEVRGCFWHSHPGCKFAVTPKSNIEFWQQKLKGNIERDRRNEAKLREDGWSVIIVWECEAHDSETLATVYASIILPAR